MTDEENLLCDWEIGSVGFLFGGRLSFWINVVFDWCGLSSGVFVHLWELVRVSSSGWMGLTVVLVTFAGLVGWFFAVFVFSRVGGKFRMTSLAVWFSFALFLLAGCLVIIFSIWEPLLSILLDGDSGYTIQNFFFFIMFEFFSVVLFASIESGAGSCNVVFVFFDVGTTVDERPFRVSSASFWRPWTQFVISRFPFFFYLLNFQLCSFFFNHHPPHFFEVHCTRFKFFILLSK